MKFLQKIGKSLMLPVACLPLCGILMGIGYLLCPASMQGGEITGMVPTIGMFLVKAGGALIDHIALLFAVGVGVGMADDQNGTAGITALVSWLIITTLLQADFVKLLLPSIADQPAALLAFHKIENPFIGILAGIIGAQSYNRFKNTDLPEWLAFFSRKRSTVIISGLISILVAAVLFFVWPILFGALVSLGRGIADMGAVGAGIYAFLNRLLIPLGLHHALNNVFWFDTIGLGDLTHFWAGHTDADVPWSLGIYMSGFFPCMMFGVPGAALAIIHCSNNKRRKYVVGILASAALCSFVCGITEPFEFAFMFCAPMLYVAYAALYGIFSYVTALVGFRAGFSFSAGATDLLFSASLPAAQNTWMILPLGFAAFVIFYLVFRVLILKFNLPTPGNESEAVDEAEETREEKAVGNNMVEGMDIASILEALGGKDNIITLDNCATRLRLELKDTSLVDEKKLKTAGAKGVISLDNSSIQVVIGMKVQKVADALRELTSR
ncbi:PTS system, N-acetylglucosamine-specific component [Anaerovibrio sp. JC8]|uniref:PTS transporter subunit EIIC n=1 Tax=Anaerovibrio sp. JC8 TaxID=1240085 RepID=UPI000A098BDE|nr:PTS transporter subunit EIIC [Anaerovibrio sp. JC8]ORT99282.1 PTS system, N-acetylglucosamine-specific component [Anaerovibrio sp. JC8]